MSNLQFLADALKSGRYSAPGNKTIFSDTARLCIRDIMCDVFHNVAEKPESVKSWGISPIGSPYSTDDKLYLVDGLPTEVLEFFSASFSYLDLIVELDFHGIPLPAIGDLLSLVLKEDPKRFTQDYSFEDFYFEEFLDKGGLDSYQDQI